MKRRRALGKSLSFFSIIGDLLIANSRAIRGMYVSSLTINLNILTPKRSAPRSLDDALGVLVIEDNRRLVIDVRIDTRLELLQHICNYLWELIVHEPSDLVCAIASEIDPRAATIQIRIAQYCLKFI